MSKTRFTAKAYTLNHQGQKVYSPSSNQLTINLTNPIFTFEILDLNTDPLAIELLESHNEIDKTNKDFKILKAYFNGNSISISAIKIGDNTYTRVIDEPVFIIDNSIVENVNQIELVLGENKSALANRKIN